MRRSLYEKLFADTHLPSSQVEEDFKLIGIDRSLSFTDVYFNFKNNYFFKLFVALATHLGNGSIAKIIFFFFILATIFKGS